MSSQATHRFNTLTPSFEGCLTVERSFMLFRCYRVPAATQSTIPAFRLPCKSVFRDSHHKVSFLKSSTITTRWPRIPSSKKPKHYTIENLSKPLPTRRNTEEVLRFFLLAAATHTTIQMPKWVCNPKTGEVDHKYEGLGSFWPEQGTKTPSQRRVSASKVLWKKFKKPHKNLENLQMLPEQPIYEEQKTGRDRKGGHPLTGAPSSLKLQSAAR